MTFGEHLMIDGYKGDSRLLNDKGLIVKSLDELPGLIGMNKVSAPEVYLVSGNNKRDPGGWSGFVVLQESHISIHTFPVNGFVTADVYTCKNNMDSQFVIEYFKKLFLLEEIESNLIKRGTKYPE